MTSRPTTEKHRPPTEDSAAPGTPALLLAFPELRGIPLPKAGAPIGRAYFDEHGRIDPEISKSHFRLSRTGGVLRIEDLGSSNGTLIDGHPIAPHSPAPLHDGAVLRLGKSLFVYREALVGPLEPDPPTGGLVGPWGLRDVRDALRSLEDGRAKAVLIQGDTGTGKELVAREVAARLRRSKPFSAVNVAALGRDTLEGHLFGWQRGSFSGADRTDPGLIRAAEGGCVFLDEIGELPIGLQAKLLRVLESGEVLPVGAHQAVKANVAFVAATNQNLRDSVREGKFRQDLLARFRVRIELPPLRKRPEDLLPLIRALWERDNEAADLERARMDVEAMELVMLHPCEDNARDLERLALMIPADRFELRRTTVEQWAGEDASAARPPPASLEAIRKALEKNDGNQSAAARDLGVDRGVVTRAVKDHPELKPPASPRK